MPDDSFASDAGEVTLLLRQMRSGDRSANEKLLPLVYDELRRLARFHMSRERPGHTLQATALVHEAFLRLAGSGSASPEGRSRFFATASHVMRNILVDYARAHKSAKRGSGQEMLPLNEMLVLAPEKSDQLMALDEALGRLEKLSPRQVRVVEMRYFAGMSVEETAEALDIAPRTVIREWIAAQAWLKRELTS